MKRISIYVLLSILTLGCVYPHTEVQHVTNVHDQTSPLGSKENPIKVGVMLLAPFASEVKGVYSGFVIDYWNNLVRSKDWQYVYIPTTQDYSQAIKDLHEGKYDILLGNFSTTYDRSFLVNFSEIYFLSEATILTSSKGLSPFQGFSKSLYKMSNILMFVFGIFLVLSCIFWMIEKKQRKFHIISSLFNTSVAMISGDTIDAPSSTFNKILFIFILIAGMHLQAVVIASMTNSTLSNDQMIDPFKDDKSMRGKTFVVVKGSNFIHIIKKEGAYVFEFDGNDDEAAKFYIKQKDNFDGYITEKVLAERYKNEFKKLNPNLFLSKHRIRNDALAFLFNKDFPYQEEINRGILYIQDNNLSFTICANSIGADDGYRCML
ncbi:MAG: transporter substrate-binding domain-containing protein [Gammaproteobacteria bacterium]|nr:transporter substrate-binding domain-containing protein [Gammaproteobacteria bacterium]